VATSQVYYMSMHVFVILFVDLCETILMYQSDMFRNFLTVTSISPQMTPQCAIA